MLIIPSSPWFWVCLLYLFCTWEVGLPHIHSLSHISQICNLGSPEKHLKSRTQILIDKCETGLAHLWIKYTSENPIRPYFNQWNKLPRRTNSKLSGHMTETMWVQWLSDAKIFSFSSYIENKLVFIRVFECGESKYGIYFLIGQFFLHTFGTFC